MYTHTHTHICMLSCVTLCDPMDCSLPGSSAHELSWQEYRNEFYVIVSFLKSEVLYLYFYTTISGY